MGRTGGAAVGGLMDALTKRCTKCGEEKGLDVFAKDRTRPDGRGSRCKACAAASALHRYYNGNVPKKPEPTKECVSCLEVKTLGSFSYTMRTDDRRAERCKSCIDNAKSVIEAKRSESIEFVRSICREPDTCKSASGVRPCHGCSLAHKAKTDPAYLARLAVIGKIGSEAIDEETRARITAGIRARHADPEYAAAHAERNREKFLRVHEDPEWQDRARRRRLEWATSEESLTGLRKRNADPEFQEKRIVALQNYFRLRRDNEEFDAFMLRMEQDQAEWEGQQNDTDQPPQGDQYDN